MCLGLRESSLKQWALWRQGKGERTRRGVATEKKDAVTLCMQPPPASCHHHGTPGRPTLHQASPPPPQHLDSSTSGLHPARGAQAQSCFPEQTINLENKCGVLCEQLNSMAELRPQQSLFLSMVAPCPPPSPGDAEAAARR